jgi:hypothetical protein
MSPLGPPRQSARDPGEEPYQGGIWVFFGCNSTNSQLVSTKGRAMVLAIPHRIALI